MPTDIVDALCEDVQVMISARTVQSISSSSSYMPFMVLARTTGARGGACLLGVGPLSEPSEEVDRQNSRSAPSPPTCRGSGSRSTGAMGVERPE
eukprot:5537169-Prymnesium_polylepis.1